MKNRILTIVFFLSVTCNLLQAKSYDTPNSRVKDNEFEQLMQKIRQDFADNPSSDKIAEELKTYNEADGSFTDVDYASIQRTNWPPLIHIDRLYDFAFAYTNPQNSHYEDEALYNTIVKGLEYWHERNPWCHNWWYNQDRKSVV